MYSIKKMSPTQAERSSVFDPDNIKTLILGSVLSTTPVEAMLPHKHKKAQIIYANLKSIDVRVEETNWSVPINHALLVPANRMHYLSKSETTELHSLFIDIDEINYNLLDPFVFKMPPFIGQLITRFLREPPSLQNSTARGKNLSLFLFDELSDVLDRKIELPLPLDRRLLRLTTLFMQEPERRLSLDGWGKIVGTSRRTLTRVFLQQTGISFGRWCREYHVKIAIKLMSEGYSVNEISSKLGYSHSSSFISMFKKITGTPPVEFKNGQR